MIHSGLKQTESDGVKCVKAKSEAVWNNHDSPIYLNYHVRRLM